MQANIVTDYDGTRLERLRAAGIPLYPHRFDHASEMITTAKFRQLFDGVVPNAGDVAGERVAVAGRILSIRSAGKLVFVDITDQCGKLQLKMDVSSWSKDNKVTFEVMHKELRDGDIIGAYGSATRTKSGELSLSVLKLQLLTPRLRLIPDKLDDITARMRDRALDLLVHPEAREKIMKRIKIVSLLREWLGNKYGMLEVETPVLHAIAGGADARPFETHHNALDAQMFLRIATELPLKQTVISGFYQGAFEIGKVFRNEDIDETHSPEFTSVEFYMPYRDYQDLMGIVEKILSSIAQEVTGSLEVKFGDKVSNWSPPWNRIDYLESLKEALGNPENFPKEDQLEGEAALAFFKAECEKRKYVSEAETVTKFMDKLFGKLVEPKCINPTFVCHHPQIMCPLAKYHRSRPGLSERFELFVFGKEIANAYTELNDPVKQRAEFAVQAGNRDKGDLEAQVTDETFCRALECGLPPTAGCGFGVDRLAMFLTDTPMLRDIQLFPMAPASLINQKSKLSVAKSKCGVIGIRRESKNYWERRAPLSPQHVRTLVNENVQVLVQKSAIRAFTDEEYARAGAQLVDNLKDADIILGVKEVPIDDIIKGKTYMFFSHTFKGKQHKYNMRRLAAYVRNDIRLIDYELIKNPDKSRAMKFGPYAGMGGMIDGLHGLGKRLLDLGYATPFLHIDRAYAYRTIQEAEAAVRRAGEEIAAFGLPKAICPLTFVFTSKGDTSMEAQRIFKLLPYIELRSPAALAKLCAADKVECYALPMFIATHEHMVKPKDGSVFNKDRYYHDAGKNEDLEAGTQPRSITNYDPIFHTDVLPYTSVLVNCMYWDRRFHRLITNHQIHALADKGKLKLLADLDITCDPAGGVEFFDDDTPINNAFYMYDPKHKIRLNKTSDAPAGCILMYGVSHIPAELPRDATQFFGDHLLPYVEKLTMIPYEKDFALDASPDNVKEATETYRGKLAPKFEYLDKSIKEFAPPDEAADAEDNKRDKGRSY